MKTSTLCILFPFFLTGCASQSYYEKQPSRDAAETKRVAAVGQGLKDIVAAFRGPGSMTNNQGPINPFASSQAIVNAPCTNCGGPSAPLPPTEATIYLSHDEDGTVAPSAIQFTDAAQIEALCDQEEPCIESGYNQNNDGLYLQAPAKGAGKAINIYNQPSSFDRRHGMAPMIGQEYNQGERHAHASGKARQDSAESLLLQYILAEKKAAAERAAAAEETRQLEAIMSAYTAAVMKKQTEQKAPYSPESTLNKIADNMPFIGAIWGMSSLGKAGIQGAKANTTANLSDGAVLSQDGSVADSGYSVPTTEIINMAPEGE